MKKYMRYALLVLLAAFICLLVGCGDPNSEKGIGSNVKFLHFVDEDGQTLLDYQLDQYFKSESLRKKLNETEVSDCIIGGGKYLDGTEFSTEKDKINDYIINHEPDLTITKKIFLTDTDCPAYTVVAELVPKPENGGGTVSDGTGIGTHVKFLHFVDNEGRTILDYQLDQYFNSEALQKKLDETEFIFSKLGKGTYSDGTEFSAEKDKINDYVINHNSDLTIPKKILFIDTDCPAYTVVVELIPIEYKITYLDIEGATFNGSETYTYQSDVKLLSPSKQYYHFLYWYEKRIDEGRPVRYLRTELPPTPYDITLYAAWAPIEFEMVYEDVAEGIPNTNEPKIYQKDGVYVLRAIPSTDAYLFKGWKCNGEYITSVDPVAIWDPSAPTWDTEAYTVTLTADIEFYDFSVNYYVDDALYDSKTLNYQNFTTFSDPAVPVKEHYTGRWSEEVTAYKNYDIEAIYDIDRFEVGVRTNIGGYSVDTKEYEYGTTYQSVYDQLSYNGKMLLGLYSDQGFTRRVNGNDLILSDGQLYAKWLDKYSIKSAADWALLSAHSDAYFAVENDINFLGEPIPVIEQFNGVLDGQNHTLSNFINQNIECALTYGLFCVNNGVISNINFTDGFYKALSTTATQNMSLGFLSGSNKGTIDGICLSDMTIKITCKQSTRYTGTIWLTAGVLAGTNEGTIENSTLTGNVKAELNTEMVAKSYDLVDNYTRTWASYGLIAGTNKGQIARVTSAASLSGESSRTDSVADMYSSYFTVYYPLRVGGIVGSNEPDGVIENAVSDANLYMHHYVNASGNKKAYNILDIGGISGLNSGQINKCYASEKTVIDAYANAETRMGGISGTNENTAVIKASYSKAKFVIGNVSKVEKTYCGGIVGLNNATVTYCYAVVKSINYNDLPYSTVVGAFGYFGGLFGYGTQSSSIISSFVKLDVAGPQGALAAINQGKAVGSATVLRCYTYLTDRAKNYALEGDAINCATEAELLTAIGKLDYELMGFTVSEGEYPVLENAGNQ